MFRYGKMAQRAVSVLSYLAEHHEAAGGRAISSAEIGLARQIAPAMTAKLLSEAAKAGLVSGTTGPGGGYRLAKPPEKIHLGEIIGIYERDNSESMCPFGPDWCGNNDPCPLHDSFVMLEEQKAAFLVETTLEVFTKPAGKVKGSSSAKFRRI